MLSGALALNLLSEDERKEINARAEEARANGVPNLQGLVSEPYAPSRREGLNVKFRSFVEAERLGYGKKQVGFVGEGRRV
jgi:hypothetical protein